jgi:hypothetical protein
MPTSPRSYTSIPIRKQVVLARPSRYTRRLNVLVICPFFPEGARIDSQMYVKPAIFPNARYGRNLQGNYIKLFSTCQELSELFP